jgi:hypothetical protein
MKQWDFLVPMDSKTELSKNDVTRDADFIVQLRQNSSKNVAFFLHQVAGTRG